MDQPIPQKRKWGLTREAFDQLLSHLNPDREQAAQEYERIRRKLMEFFDGWGCLFPEDYADETMNRVARILDERRTIEDLNSYYFLGVARNVLKEYWREQKKEAQGSNDPSRIQANDGDEADETRTMEPCMERCLQHLPRSDREFIIRYYQGEKREKIEARKGLARQFGLTALQIRKRAFKIRNALRVCVEECLEKFLAGGNEFNISASSIWGGK